MAGSSKAAKPLREPASSSGGISSLLAPKVHHHQFEFGHLLDRIARPLLAEARFLQAAIGHEVGAPLRAPVDMEVAGLDLAGETHGVFEILGEDRRRKPVV